MTDSSLLSPRPVLIALSGLPGVGKTTIASELAVALGAVHLRIDSIEQALRNAGMTVYDEGYRVAYVVAEDNLRLGRIVISDCVNPWPLTRNEWHAVASRASARAIRVELVCSDVEEHKRRIDTRSPDIANHRVPSWTEVLAHDYRPWDRDRMVVDTARLDVSESVHRIVLALALDPHVA